MEDFEAYLHQIADDITVSLNQLIPAANGHEAQLMRAMRYAALAGGKRLRPFFVIEVGRLFKVKEMALLRTASALECVHTYSLIHDDLPCMDDDDLRRGQPTVHIAYDEATAILAGDALLSLAFEILSDHLTHQDAIIRSDLVLSLSQASGPSGMVGGQMLDMLAEHNEDAKDIHYITRLQRLKTGALISCACELGAILGGATDAERQALHGFSHDLGLAYQIVDDILDAEGDSEKLGKKTRKDIQHGKANFVTLLGVAGAKQRVQLLADQAKDHIQIFHSDAKMLLQSVDYVIGRQN